MRRGLTNENSIIDDSYTIMIEFLLYGFHRKWKSEMEIGNGTLMGSYPNPNDKFSYELKRPTTPYLTSRIKR